MGSTTPLDRTSNLTYGPNNELIQVTDQLGNVTSFQYDGGGRLRTLTDPKGVVTTYAYDGFGNVVSEQSTDTGTQLYGYDAAGNLVKYTRGAGTADQVVVDFTYDRLNRLMLASSSTRSDSYTYDACNYGKGRLCIATSGSTSDTFSYTPTGMLASHSSVIAGTAYLVQRQYDGIDRLTQVTYPNGHQARYEYNSQDQITAVKVVIGGVVQTIASSFTRYHYGPLKSYTFNNGTAASKTYDKNHRISTDAPARNYIHNLYDELGGFFDSGGVLTQYGYRADSRLNAIRGTEGTEDFTLDGNGNRLTHVRPGGTDTFSYVANSNRIASISGSRPRTFTYFADGNIKTDTGFRGSRTYTYDKVGNWTSSISVNGSITNYAFNAFHHRVRKTRTGVSVNYLMSPEGTMLAETGNAGGTMNTNYVWLHGQLIAAIRDSSIYYVLNDHIARPREVLNSSGTTVWKATGKAFDREVVLDTFGGLNLGFPGQYYDAESGDWYNVHRYYDSTLGRYTQPDPIGLAGGLNRYAYVDGNPVTYADPNGLWQLPTNTIMLQSALASGQVQRAEHVVTMAQRHVAPAQRQFILNYASAVTGAGSLIVPPLAYVSTVLSSAAIVDTFVTTGERDFLGIATTVASAGPAALITRGLGAGPEIANIVQIGAVYTDVGHSALDSAASAGQLVCP